jgi:hypothetical protein
MMLNKDNVPDFSGFCSAQVGVRLAHHLVRYDYNYPIFVENKDPDSNKWSVTMKITPKCDIPANAVGSRGIGRTHEVEAEGNSFMSRGPDLLLVTI